MANVTLWMQNRLAEKEGEIRYLQGELELFMEGKPMLSVEEEQKPPAPPPPATSPMPAFSANTKDAQEMFTTIANIRLSLEVGPTPSRSLTEILENLLTISPDLLVPQATCV